MTAASPSHGRHPLRGAILCLGGVFFFACMDTTTKYLTASFDVPLVVAMRYLVNLALLVVFLVPREGMRLMETRRTGLVWVRAGCLCAVSLFVTLGLQRIPVAENTAIIFLGPMLIVLVARPLLGETIGLLGWLAALTGFVGVLFIARPDSGLDGLGIVFTFLAVLANVAYQLLSRVLASTERTVTLLFYSAVAGSILYGLAVPWYWSGVPPTALQALLFLSLGIFASLAHYLFTAAFRDATASLLAPVTYMQLLWAGLLGWLVFGHVPDGWTVVGMGIIMLSGLLIAFKTRHAMAGAARQVDPPATD